MPDRDYAAELAEYARVAAPICGYPPAMLEQRVSLDRRVGEINVALCESHLMDYLQPREVNLAAMHDEWVCIAVGMSGATGKPTRLRALIDAVARTKGEE